MDRRSGWLLALLSAAAFGTSGVFASALLDAGWTAGAAVTVRVGVAALVLSPLALLQLRGRWSLLRGNLGGVLAFGVFAVAGCQLTYFLAVSRLSVGVALLLEYSGVVLVVLWAWARTGQRPSAVTTAGVVVAVGGLVLVLDVASGARIDALGVVYGLLAAVGLAVYYVVSGRTDDALPPLVTAWAGMAVGAGVLGLSAAVQLLPWSSGTADVVLAGRTTSWLVPVLGLALLAGSLAYASGVAAVQRLGSRLASFTGLTEVLFAVLFAWAVLDEQPGVVQGIGAVVVLTGIVLVKLGERPVVAAVDQVGPVDLPVDSARR
ncbi:EamA family transporter [Modestobacter sp. I12A-02628]|uniref:DMT family transporter n=1 Tax=Goekera deserti TaxID=2497753 RepID=A0A7K3WB12_9ACTN|nr:DMT family transporter [Goekera deserti]MPQ98883.1 EamA family transporter [Goekera deserti]NDI49618.1 EamA family transporter [Goekera deserti]NEL53189.1 DMT family transporter [Goekera deserti]